MAIERRAFTSQQKADIIKTFDALPEGKTGERGHYMREHHLGWSQMQRWRKDRGVRKLLQTSPEPPGQKAAADTDRVFKLPSLVAGRKRQLTLRQKVQVLAHYDSLGLGTPARGDFLRRYSLHWGMLNRWRGELKREGIAIPDVSRPTPIMNGAEPPAKRPGHSKTPPKSLLSKLSGEQILQLVRERRNSQIKAYDSVLEDLEDLLK